jgi:predicted ATP-grasp superfamily ATP-dependent carboligase
MNLLVTNSHELQAYVIATCLRKETDRLVITEGGESVVASEFRGMLSYSRYVDARHPVPYFADDWLAGRLHPENTAAEEAYIRRIEEICARERIDTVFPSLDPEVYLFAKNKARLARQGVVAVVPEPDVLRVPMDKALTIRTAQRIGFPCPRTFFPVDESDLDRILTESAPPWILKPRFSAHGSNMALIAEPPELKEAYAGFPNRDRWPILQEYVPGGVMRMFYLMIGHDSEVITVMSPECIRAFRGGYRVSPRTVISSSTGPYLSELRVLARELGLWGAYTVQTKMDPRDGQPKLMEINARFGHHSWRRAVLGVNEPLILLRLAQGRPVEGNLTYPEGVMLLDPVKDLLYLFRQAVETLPGVSGMIMGRDDRRLKDPIEVNPRGVMATLRVYAREYFAKGPKAYAPDVSNVFADPLACASSVWFNIGREIAEGARRVGRAVRRRIGSARPAAAHGKSQSISEQTP